MVRSWNLAAAKARLSEVIDLAQENPQVIQKRGVDVAVVLSTHEAARLGRSAAAPQPRPMDAFLELTAALRSDGDLTLVVAKRRATRGRANPFEG